MQSKVTKTNRKTGSERTLPFLAEAQGGFVWLIYDIDRVNCRFSGVCISEGNNRSSDMVGCVRNNLVTDLATFTGKIELTNDGTKWGCDE